MWFPTLTIDRADLEEAMIGATPLQQQITDGRATLDGDTRVLHTLAAWHDLASDG